MSIRTSDDHSSKTIKYDIRAARKFARPLKTGEPTPGCSCETCAGIRDDHPARKSRYQTGDHPEWEAKAEAARSIPILEICERLGIEVLKRAKDGFYASCPFHSDSDPSLHISPDQGRSGLWYCFSCGSGGDALELYMRQHRMTFPESVRALS